MTVFAETEKQTNRYLGGIMGHKLGIIGYGTMGSWHAANVRDRISDLDVALVYDINEEKIKKAQAEGFTTCGSAQEIYESDVDIVLIATPNDFHKDYSIAALNAGKNVVCEKPACMTVVELEEVIAASKRNGKIYTVHQNRRWDIDYDIARNILKQNLVGKPHQIYSRLYSNRNIPGDWRTIKSSGGGFLYDWGVHMIDQVLWMVDSKPVSVYAQLHHIYQTEVDDAIRVNINFENGVCAHIVADSWTFVNESRWHISGNDGTARIDNWFGRTGKIIKANVKKVDWTQGCVYTHNGLSRSMWPRPESEVEEIPLPISEKEPRWEEFYENLMATIEGKATQIVTHDEVRASLRVIEAAFESAEKCAVVKL
ncbi:MAG: Gfo/Idh/MocA family oxidoreductase [Ruminococcaceae bacterium]|nr:Gfo/Idh/MocA family oxidoreductase [Oscillospiraceae bacterium]